MTFFFFERKAGGKNFAPSLTPFQLLRSIRIFDFRGQCNGWTISSGCEWYLKIYQRSIRER